MKTYKKSKRIKVFLIVLALIIVLGGVFIYFDWFYMGSNTFNVISETSLDNSKYEDNGYWWGFNQNKVASINDAVFTFTYDNFNLTNGNSSETNPYTCEFYIVRNSIKEKRKSNYKPYERKVSERKLRKGSSNPQKFIFACVREEQKIWFLELSIC